MYFVIECPLLAEKRPLVERGDSSNEKWSVTDPKRTFPKRPISCYVMKVARLQSAGVGPDMKLLLSAHNLSKLF
jgi:hypothetical protein